MIERVHLEILRTITRVKTVTEVANELFLTQSAISHAIRKLEQRMGVRVWEKKGRNLQLTQAGNYLVALADRVLPQMEHAEQMMQNFAEGRMGTLRIGMECHPCYRWLLRVVAPFLEKWPMVDVDVRTEFQFEGIGPLLNYDIDLLVTPDPLFRKSLTFESVFDYELKLVVSGQHRLANRRSIQPEDLIDETLISYPVSTDRLDVFKQFLIPAGCSPRKHQQIETTDIMLQMVAANRGVTALPDWLLKSYAKQLSIKSIRIGKQGIQKQIFVGLRKNDAGIEYVKSFLKIAKQKGKREAPRR